MRWGGLVSDYFSVLNGVKQGGVVSPVLFCIYIDDLLYRLSQSGVGCFVGAYFCGALAYADDIVLLAPCPSAMRKLLAICDNYAAAYDIQFNPEKSKLLVAGAHKRYIKQTVCCSFYVGGRLIEKVDKFSHLGHIVMSSLSDRDDIAHARNSFIGQTNNVLCFFSKVDTSVKLKLFRAYCSSLYGCEVWELSSSDMESICVAWRKALRRILNLPYNTHSSLIPVITETLPIFDEICRRTARFIYSCYVSPSQLVRFVSRYCVVFGKHCSTLGSNALFLCDRYDLSYEHFIVEPFIFSQFSVCNWYKDSLSFEVQSKAAFLSELISIRDGHLRLSNDGLSKAEITDIITFISTA